MTKAEIGDRRRREFINSYQDYKAAQKKAPQKKKWTFKSDDKKKLENKFLEAASKYANYLSECERREAERKA